MSFNNAIQRIKLRGALVGKRALDATAGVIAVAVLKIIRRFDPEKTSRFAGRLTQRIGPWFKEDRIGRENLRAAFPEKSANEIDAILREVWYNIGQVGAEYAHLDKIGRIELDANGLPKADGRIIFDPQTRELFDQLRDDGKPALIFAAHLANWELPAVTAAVFGLKADLLYRPPSIGDVAEAINRIRAINMGRLVATGSDAPIKLAATLERGDHAGMLVDQHQSRGVDVVMFGRPCKANPTLARLARHFPDCPIHGVRVIRLPEHKFRIELTPAIEPARTATGAIDITATTQRITDVIEGWVREYPAQWLWLHRRWRS
ncbi:lipid A biosynthesis (KDO)2-(lauroyl)-lipid IVA acyltransferase [Variibacter gotjawalensis]|uniref:Lipid A biosynthesis (KDO)2-(Lauroyl)-lipid IVA acyltransferase n=1 Tax=Variibacter gotjawalensis TaxID=1333996 RepID=A0A0S3PYW0_9BRAD|nr:lipid A biosynthesis lauroyl acyltransferase [Variibacter gotjawalensis]NIK46947.1 KDO2-lipid IV(A) lauroyltransferase [Variibacter gotjawalensis]RZS48851.1 KDO2-lipid IV(A) lauroyltransferase [Variibacter gotjawalensis]BAT61110.1 lipid A biosynthesis (KDO)2-(lauroyl)-lipid IVA acyltransferase [Variibacter gotjawalensis]